MAIGFRDRPLRHHAHLRATPDHDHALAVDGLEGRHLADLCHSPHLFEVGDHLRLLGDARNLKLQLGDRLAASRSASDVRDVRAVAKDRFGDPIEDARLVAAFDEQARRLGPGHGRER